MSLLSPLGWGPFFASQLRDEELATLLPGRAIQDRGTRLLVQFEDAQRLVFIPGRLKASGHAPVVGDFVLTPPDKEPPVIRVLERKSALVRGAAGRAATEQVLAANLDLVLLVMGLDEGLNPRRLERSLAAAYASGAKPIVVLTKADLADSPSSAVENASRIAQGVPVILASSRTGEGMDELRGLLSEGTTAVLLGASGAGKSTLLNMWIGEAIQETREVRASDKRGQHCTTGRKLIVLPSGGALIDGPGIRELKLWDGSGVEETFQDLTALAEECRFRDCRHEGEPGCAVEEAIHTGKLDPARLLSRQKLSKEVQTLEARQSGSMTRLEKQRWKSISKEQKRFQRDKQRTE